LFFITPYGFVSMSPPAINPMKTARGLLRPVLPSFFALLIHAHGALADDQLVSSLTDSGPGSLRSALALAASRPGAETLTFAPALSGQTITLNSQLSINDLDGITVDASTLPGGLTLTDTGDVNHRLISVEGGIATLRALTMANGGGNSFATNTGTGGALLNNGTLFLDQCTFLGNTASSGGAVFNSTTSDFTTTRIILNRCTLSGNTATSQGGAITNHNGRSTLRHCTISGNNAPADSGSGVTSLGNTLTETVVQYCIVAANADSNVHFVQGGANSFTSQGYNLIGTGNATGDFNQPGDQINPSNLNLSPLNNYGGPSQTIALQPLSAARNAALGSTATSDQRGFPIIGAPDIGAYEAGTTKSFNAWISEALPASTPSPQYAGNFDFDGDGQSNALEYATLGNPLVPGSGQNLTLARNAAGTQATLVMPYRYSAPDLTYTIERSTSLAAWTPIANMESGTNLFYPTTGISLTANNNVSVTFTDTFIPGQPRVFYRLNATVKTP
jgi:hypothetical protein